MDLHPLLPLIRTLHDSVRRTVREACERASIADLSGVAADEQGDTIYQVDRVSEAALLACFEREAEALGGLVLIAEGIGNGEVALPRGSVESASRWRIIVDPIDGTRELMYQKRSGWILTGVAANRGAETRLSDIELAVQTEIPVVKQNLADTLWAVRGRGAQAERTDLASGERRPIRLRPSSAPSIAHGFAMISRFFPGGRDVLAAIDDEVAAAALGPVRRAKGACFEDQYLSSGGQLYELMAGHYRFVADLRPLLAPLLAERGAELGICCHPYDLCTELIAREMGVIVTAPDGGPFDAPMNLEAEVAWTAYANQAIRAQVEAALQAALHKRGLL